MQMKCAFGLPGNMIRCSDSGAVQHVAKVLNSNPEQRQQIVIYFENHVMIQDLQHDQVLHTRKLPLCSNYTHCVRITIDSKQDEEQCLQRSKNFTSMHPEALIVIFKKTNFSCGFAWIGSHMLLVRGHDPNDFFYLCGLEFGRNAQVTLLCENETTFHNTNIQQFFEK